MAKVVPVVLMCLLATVACRDRTNEPTLEQRRHPVLLMTCDPAGANVACSARVTDTPSWGTDLEVTSLAVWMASDTSVGRFVAPGVFTPDRRGEVGLSVRYRDLEVDEPQWFLVDPASAARWLYWLYGPVADDASGVKLTGADVLILDGYARGTHSTTNENGYYRIDRLLTGEVFSARASKDGYESLTKSYRVDPPRGLDSNTNYLEFRLHRSAQASPP
jgi:hypothetical protein